MDSGQPRRVQRSDGDQDRRARAREHGHGLAIAARGLEPDRSPLTFRRALGRPAAPMAKRAIDVILSLVSLTVLIPLFLVIAVCVKLDSEGPVFFRAVR